MTISSTPDEAVLFFSREELAAAVPSQEEILTLIRRSGQKIPQNVEVKCFPSRQGILVFVHSRLPELTTLRHFSGTFS